MTKLVFNVLKPSGMTSHDVVSFIRRTLQMKKVGHAGTLDPDAAGVLPIFVGQATRLIEYSTDSSKTYRVHLKFGVKTDTGDDSGTEIARSIVRIITDNELQAVLNKFMGKIEQIPPMYSAIKINGQKLCNLARKGTEVERVAREIYIYDIKILQKKVEGLFLEVECSKGTYIRTLIENIAESLGMCATMTFLLRTRVGHFHIADSYTLEQIAANFSLCTTDFEGAIADLLQINLTANQALRFSQGVATTIPNFDFNIDNNYRVYGAENNFIGIGKFKNSLLCPEKVFG